MRNVSRCWTYETGRLMGCDLPDEYVFFLVSSSRFGCHLCDAYRLPESSLVFHNFYMDTGRLRIQTSNMRNANTPDFLEKIKIQCLQNLSKSVIIAEDQMDHGVPSSVQDSCCARLSHRRSSSLAQCRTRD